MALFAYFSANCLIMLELIDDFNKQFSHLINNRIFSSDRRRKNLTIIDRLELIDKKMGY